MLTDLDLINACLGTMGSAPTDAYVQQRVSAGALKARDRQNKRIQGQRWWFNTETLTLNPNLSGVITAPAHPVLTAIGAGGAAYTVRDDNILRDSIGRPVTTSRKVALTYEIPFATLPQMAAQAVFDAAVLEFQKNFAEDAAMTAKLEAQFAQSYATLAEENMRAILNGSTYYVEPVDA